MLYEVQIPSRFASLYAITPCVRLSHNYKRAQRLQVCILSRRQRCQSTLSSGAPWIQLTVLQLPCRYAACTSKELHMLYLHANQLLHWLICAGELRLPIRGSMGGCFGSCMPGPECSLQSRQCMQGDDWLKTSQTNNLFIVRSRPDYVIGRLSLKHSA